MSGLKGVIWSVVCFVLVLLFISLISGCSERRGNNKETEIFKEGIEFGMELHIKYLSNQLETCEIVPLNLGNKIVRIIALDCVEGG